MRNIPASWEEEFATPGAPSSRVRSLPVAKTNAWVESRPSGEMCEQIREIAKEAAVWFVDNGKDGAHEYMGGVVWGLVKDAHSGHSGLASALEIVRRSFLSEAGPRRKGAGTAASEFDRSLRDAVSKVVGLSSVPSSECSCASVAGWEIPRASESEEERERRLETKVNAEADRLEIARRARQRIAAASWVPPTDTGSLAAQFAADRPPPEYFVEDLLMTGQNALLIAQYKVGKTTLLGNLAKAAVDGTKFLDKKVSLPKGRTVAYMNLEVGEGQFVEWLRDMDIEHPERMHVLHLRGDGLPLPDPTVEDFYVEYLRERNVSLWIVDPLAAAFEGENNSNSEMGMWVKSLDRIKKRAGVSEMVMAAHTGNSEEASTRAVGASRQMGWADVFWVYRHGAGLTSGRNSRSTSTRPRARCTSIWREELGLTGNFSRQLDVRSTVWLSRRRL